MIKRSIRIIILAIVSVGLFSAIQDTNTNESVAKTYVQKLFRTWSWQKFWEGGYHGWRYSPGTNATLSLFWNRSALGFCSSELRYCAAYELSAGNLGQVLAVQRLGASGTLQERMQDFISTHKPNSTNWDQSGLTTSEITVELPELDLSKYWAAQRSPADLGDVVAMLKALHANGGRAGKREEFTLPIYDARDPELFVLVRAEGGDEAVLFFVHDRTGNEWRLGGHFDADEGREKLARYSTLIRRNRLTSFSVD
jgi:hypothetical protein